MGLAGVLTNVWPGWIPPVGVVGGVFLGLAGAQHLRNIERTTKENVAMATDLFVALMIAIHFAAMLASLI